MQKRSMINTKLFSTIALLTAAAFCIFASETNAQKKRAPKYLSVCGNPNVTCPSDIKFEPYDLPFRFPAKAVIYETELFYAVILKSVPVPKDNCDTFISEPDRLAAQLHFPNNKVFTSRCADPGTISYTNINPRTHFMAVYAGLTQAQANRMLVTVQATGKFPGAYVRRIRAGMNGT